MRMTLSEQLLKWERHLLALLIYVLPVHEAGKNILWGILVSVWIWRCLVEKKWPHVGGMDLRICLWLAAGMWSCWFAIEPQAGWKGLWDMIRAAMLFWIVGSHNRSEEIRHVIIRHLVLSTALASMIAIFQCVWSLQVLKTYPPNVHVELRSVGHFNQSGIYLAMGWLVALTASSERRVFVRPWIAKVTAALIGLALLGSMARSAIAVAGFATVIILWKSRPPRWVVRLLILGVVVMVAGFSASSTIRNRVLFRGSLSNRIAFWQSALDMAESRPWTGVGLNNFRNLHLQTIEPWNYGTIDHAHNLYFGALGQMGVPGAIALLALISSSGAAIWKQHPTPNGGDAIVFCTAGGVWLVITLVGLSNTTLHHEMAMFFFMVMGLIPGTDARVMNAMEPSQNKSGENTLK